jgi:ABC-type glutathione transport system ATPase component
MGSQRPKIPDGLRLRDLHVAGPQGTLVDGVHIEVLPGRIHVLVGASGSGKTLTARSFLGMVDARPGVTRASLEVTWNGESWRPYDDLDLNTRRGKRELERRFRPLRGSIIGYLPQDARRSLDPLWTIARQLRAALALRREPHEPEPRVWLERAGFPQPDRIEGLYPHELSGGMAQRASIALALARGSRFLLADEPTTGLDPTVQEAILRELQRLRDREGVGILLITHDLRIVPRLADRLFVMHAGRLVEDLPADRLGQMESDHARELWDATARISGGVL